MSMTDAELVEWTSKNYAFRINGGLICRRCAMDHINWTTKHAAVRHGDDIDIEPIDPEFLNEDELRW